VGLAVGLVMLALANERERELKNQETAAREMAQQNEKEAQEQRGLAEANLVEAQSQKGLADAARIKAEREKQRAEEQRERAEQLVYCGNIALAQRLWQENDAGQARSLLEACRTDLRGWEHGYLSCFFESNQKTLIGHSASVHSVAFSPDGTRIVSGSWDTTLRVWDAQTGQEILSLQGHTGGVVRVTFSPDGKRLVSGSGDKTLKVWDPQTGQETLTL